jgi:xanthine dehydrogenase YagS FAD-binding subunit
MHRFQHINAPNLSTAIKLLGQPQTTAIAGGTDLLAELKRRIKKPRCLVNLKSIPGLNKIHLNKNLRIGGLVTLAEIERHLKILRKFPIIHQAISLAATPHLRNMGTVGGNLCQHPRCWYYRSPLFPCWLKGGKKCFAVNGENRYHAILGGRICHAVHPSDLAPALMALDGSVMINGQRGRRTISLENLYRIPGKNHRPMTILKPNELITEIRVPIPPKNTKGIFLKAMERKSWSFALVSVAAQLSFDGDRIEEARLVLGGVAPIPWRAKEAGEILRGERISEEVIKAASEAAVKDAKPLKNNEYKVQLAKGLIGQALHKLHLEN